MFADRLYGVIYSPLGVLVELGLAQPELKVVPRVDDVYRVKSFHGVVVACLEH